MTDHKQCGTDIVAIVPAAGTGSRMCAVQPKQYLTIGSLTLLEHSVYALLKNPRIRHVVVAIPPEDRTFFQLTIATDSRVSSVTGGNQRADSVLAGLRHPVVQQAEWALVHDAARPCLHQQDLKQLLQITAHTSVGALLAAPVRDTIKRSRQGSQQIEQTIDRSALWHALTPQLFLRELLTECLVRALDKGATVTDEASALEFCGYQPLLVPGRYDNIKVTCPEDLALAQFYLSYQEQE